MTGLTNEQVQERIAEGKVNANENPNTRTYKQIIQGEYAYILQFPEPGAAGSGTFCTFLQEFHVYGDHSDQHGDREIIQEVRAKKTIDKLAILTESKTVVLREGKKWNISTEKLVIDDLIFLKTGDQVPADVKILEGSVEVNEFSSDRRVR